MTRPSSLCCLPPRIDAMELTRAKISRCVCSIAVYVGLQGGAVRVE